MDPWSADVHDTFGALIEKRLHRAEIDEERLQLDRHLADCEPCRRYLEEAGASHAPMIQVAAQCAHRTDWAEIDEAILRRQDPRVRWTMIGAIGLVFAAAFLEFCYPEAFRMGNSVRLALMVLLAAIPVSLYALGLGRQAARLTRPLTEIATSDAPARMMSRITRFASQPVAELGLSGRLALFGSLCLLVGLNLNMRHDEHRPIPGGSSTVTLPGVTIEVSRHAYVALNVADVWSDNATLVEPTVSGEYRTEIVLLARSPGRTLVQANDTEGRRWIIPVEVVPIYPWPLDWTVEQRMKLAAELARAADADYGQLGPSKANLISALRLYRDALRLYENGEVFRADWYQVGLRRMQEITNRIPSIEHDLVDQFWAAYHAQDGKRAELFLNKLLKLYEVPADYPLAAYGDDPKHEEYLRLRDLLHQTLQDH